MEKLKIFGVDESNLVVESLKIARFTILVVDHGEGNVVFIAPSSGVSGTGWLMGLYQDSLPEKLANGPAPKEIAAANMMADIEAKKVFIFEPTNIPSPFFRSEIQSLVSQKLPKGWQAHLVM